MSEHNDETEVAALQQALLDNELLETLICDIEQCADDVEVRWREGSPQAPALQEILAELRNGTLSHVQIRYRHGGQRWCDTLTWRPDGVHLVRAPLDDAAP